MAFATYWDDPRSTEFGTIGAGNINIEGMEEVLSEVVNTYRFTITLVPYHFKLPYPRRQW